MLGVDVLDEVAVEALSIPHRRLEADRVLHEVEQLLDALLREAALLCKLGLRRLAVELLRKLPARAHEAPNLVCDVNRKPDSSALVGQRSRDRLPDPPRRIRRELVAHLVVE